MNLECLTVRDIMSAEVVTLEKEENLELAQAIMRLGRLRHLPVVDDGKLVGLVTHRDILRASASVMASFAEHEQRALLAAVKVEDIMHEKVGTASPEALLRDVARQMLDKKWGCLPVVEEGKLIGIVTEADFLRVMIELLDAVCRMPKDLETAP